MLDIFDLFIFALRALGILKKPVFDTLFGNSMLLSTEEMGSNMIIPVDSGYAAGYSYATVLDNKYNTKIIVQLKGRTDLHILMSGRLSEYVADKTVETNGYKLRSIELEGDFPNDFTVFTKEGMELELLQLLDPATMAYLADYCLSYDIEVKGSSICVARAANAIDESDKTDMMTDLRHLLSKNKLFFDRLGKSDPVVAYDPAKFYLGDKKLYKHRLLYRHKLDAYTIQDIEDKKHILK